MTANQPLTGVDGALVLLNGAPTTTTAEAFTNITTLPGGSYPFTSKQIYSVTARAKKVVDPRVTPIVYVGGTPVPSTQYEWDYGAGMVVFYTPRPETTPVVTADFTYVPTNGATDQIVLPHTNNIQIGTAGNQVPLDEYRKKIIPQGRGKMQGTFQFDYLSSDVNIDLFMLMRIQKYFIFAAFEDVKTNRMRIVYCDLTGIPENIPGEGAVGGTITASLKELPSFLNEVL